MTISFEHNSKSSERRRQGRAGLAIDVQVRERSRSAMTARLVDLNSFGCQVEGLVLVSQDGNVWIRLPGLESLALRQVWNEGSRFGFAFETPLHPAVAARFMPAKGSHAASAILPTACNDEPMLSRREQIMAGIAATEHSPLQRKKKPSGLGLTGRINRHVKRLAETRIDPRFADAVPEGTTLEIAGRPVEVLNVSCSGMKITGDLGEKDIGDDLSVEFSGFEPMTGRLVWLSESEAGIALPPQSIDLVDRTH